MRIKAFQDAPDTVLVVYKQRQWMALLTSKMLSTEPGGIASFEIPFHQQRYCPTVANTLGLQPQGCTYVRKIFNTLTLPPLFRTYIRE